ncbi:hypothetical protein BCR32DRAFT_246995 [Anaeromyces robustus]|uniref:G-protein coupled receptors family 3 profile domain-containing protein n=1 Tax=Anaeromyces robustus TaxID=1754192 RepID=A0A1Y1WZU7_9FUNG|nr:hypothetical protein BCR32DRAFT_246995 [Anaeromyces robustus]|eukprot:ORX78624.1 hypothetical protein BCR32DRAFT_246995 [Anaeromyces robustus]
MKKLEHLFCFLSKPSWVILMIGIIMILSSGYTNFGIITNINCHIRNICISIGFTLIYIPILHKLIINFPDENKYSIWIKKHKYFFILIFILIDFILLGITLMKSHGVKTVTTNKGEKFQICHTDNILIKIILIIILTYKCIIILTLSILIFMEWNITETFYDIRFIMTSIYINIISFVLILIINSFININNHILYFIIKESLIYITSIINYILLYIIKIILPVLIKKDETTEIIEKIRVYESFLENAETQTTELTVSNINTIKTKNSNSSSVPHSILSKILNYHERT